MTTATLLEPRYISRGERALSGLISLAPSLAHAAILTDDGFSLVSVDSAPPELAALFTDKKTIGESLTAARRTTRKHDRDAPAASHTNSRMEA